MVPHPSAAGVAPRACRRRPRRASATAAASADAARDARQRAELRREQRARGAAADPAAGARLALFVGVWALRVEDVAAAAAPAKTWASAVDLFSDPFYRKGPNDQGIGWNILTSLQRVGIGFGLAALVGIPLGFIIGRFRFLSRMAAPIISLLRPVSPLAWLPIGLLVFKAANPAAIWVIFISRIWPMVINTAAGVRAFRRTTSTSRAC